MFENTAALSNSDTRRAIAVAILRQSGKFLMQLRDDNPAIRYPGHWGFFGGHLEPGETADFGIQRELLEEIEYCPPGLTAYARYEEAEVIRHIYYGELDVDVSQLVLHEGMDLQFLTVEDIQRGDRYSEKVNQVRPLVPPLRQVLLNFICQNP